MIIVAMRNHCNVHLIQINSQFLCIIRKNSAPPCIKENFMIRSLDIKTQAMLTQ